MTVAPLPVPEPVRRLLVPAWTLVAALVAALALGSLMFALGRAARPAVVAGDDSTALLAALVRIDTAIVANDTALARQLLEQAPLPAGRAADAAVALRRKVITGVETVLATNAELRSSEAVAKRLAGHLHRLDQTGLTWTSVPAARSLEPSTLAGESFTPLARIVHPDEPQRVYAIHPAKGLLLSIDGGATWRSGLAPLAALTGTDLAFSADPKPLVLVLGAEIWAFDDGDPAFFPH